MIVHHHLGCTTTTGFNINGLLLLWADLNYCCCRFAPLLFILLLIFANNNSCCYFQRFLGLPFAIFAQMATSAQTPAGLTQQQTQSTIQFHLIKLNEILVYLEGQIVSFFGPQILTSLTLGPTTGAAATTQIVQDRGLPLIEALAMHQAAGRAMLVVTQHLNNFTTIFMTAAIR